MQLVFSTIPRRQTKPIAPPSDPSVPTLMENKNKNKTQLQREISIFTPTPIPNPFQFMIQRIQYENPHCNSCGK
jgi:hypothetical protein